MQLAEILIVGDELLAGEIADANGPFVAGRLASHGFRVRQLQVVPDDLAELAAAVSAALERVEAVVVCGGLGPTSDDLTTAAVAVALGRPLVHDEASWQQIRSRFAAIRGCEPPPGNEKQALFPAGAQPLPNPNGTAPGFVAEAGDGRFVAVFPGPPRENRPMFDRAFLAWLTPRQPEVVPLTTVVCRVFGLGESVIGQKLAPLEPAHPAVRFGYQFRFPEVMVKLRATAADGAALAAATADVQAALAPHVYGLGETTLPELLGQRLAARDLRLVLAESCTGGLAAKLLTDAPGASAWVERGFVTYSNAAKEELLGVPAALLAEHGAVSEPVAAAMLAGALSHSPAELGLAVTGIAGPAGGTPDKPVGTVCFAWGDRQRQQVVTRSFGAWEREQVRLFAAWYGFERLLRWLDGA